MHTKSENVQLTHDLLSEYSSARENWAKQAVEDNEFRNGKQWTEEEATALKQRSQQPIVVNVVYSAVEQAKAMLTSNKPKFQSTGRDDSGAGGSSVAGFVAGGPQTGGSATEEWTADAALSTVTVS